MSSNVKIFYDRRAYRPYVAVIPPRGKRKACVIYADTRQALKTKLRRYFHKPLDIN